MSQFSGQPIGTIIVSAGECIDPESELESPPQHFSALSLLLHLCLWTLLFLPILLLFSPELRKPSNLARTCKLQMFGGQPTIHAAIDSSRKLPGRGGGGAPPLTRDAPGGGGSAGPDPFEDMGGAGGEGGAGWRECAVTSITGSVGADSGCGCAAVTSIFGSIGADIHLGRGGGVVGSAAAAVTSILVGVDGGGGGVGSDGTPVSAVSSNAEPDEGDSGSSASEVGFADSTFGWGGGGGICDKTSAAVAGDPDLSSSVSTSPDNSGGGVTSAGGVNNGYWWSLLPFIVVSPDAPSESEIGYSSVSF
ncbi:hypothetical protein F3Y22_tig00110187pilonHSYRG00318 [Hibiscus syriacus]|uniref:Uncharacterized protein n=1 Tax=Hibiscus syriacus TaxID=106335 RepID=A0A6A3BFU9_HIBSY|nr:hypothetical protein F3Y22_tig00110187pilonHSYRG00318 [Hibiscus syriacus]